MPSLDKNFKELQSRLKQGRSLNQAGDDPVFYLVFRPEEMLEVKRQTKSWIAKLKHDDWKVHLFSMAEAVHSILKDHDLRPIWLEGEQEDPLNFEDINKTLGDALTADDALKNILKEKLTTLAGNKDNLLLITDVEVLHPYLRIGGLEQKLQGNFHVPTVILYPGLRVGRTTLKFLGIYPEDGNYRSIHIGG